MARSSDGEVRMVLIGCFIAPGVPDAISATSRRTFPLGLGRKPSASPGAVRRRLEPTHTHHGTTRMTQLPLPVIRRRVLPIIARRPELLLTVTAGIHKTEKIDNRHRVAA